MSYQINALKKPDHLVTDASENVLETLPEVYATKEDAIAFITANLEAITLSDVMFVAGITYNGSIYHYFQIEETI